MLTVDEALDKLKQHGITDSGQMVRRWLREGKLKGTRSEYRKEGWRIPTQELDRFIEEKYPAAKYQREIEQLKARVAELETKNQKLRGQLNNVTQGNIEEGNNNHNNITTGNIKELSREEVKTIWTGITRDDLDESDKAPELLEEAYNSLVNGLFPKGADKTETYNHKYRRPYVSPFTNRKYSSAEALVRASIPWLIQQKKAIEKREREKENYFEIG